MPFGGMDERQQGKWDHLTMWEQLDLGVQYTTTRKFFTAIPIIMYGAMPNGPDANEALTPTQLHSYHAL
jgi:hypothetical protein